MARHCPECGFVVAEGANYCPKCGAFQGAAEQPSEDVTTATYVIDDQTGELKPVDVGDVAAQSGALVVRSGGGRVGQSFPMQGEKMTIGRSPETDVFLDDVTVSRDHATLVRRGDSSFWSSRYRILEIEMSGNSCDSALQTAPMVSDFWRWTGSACASAPSVPTGSVISCSLTGRRR